jgi:hypothetical protein
VSLASPAAWVMSSTLLLAIPRTRRAGAADEDLKVLTTVLRVKVRSILTVVMVC